MEKMKKNFFCQKNYFGFFLQFTSSWLFLFFYFFHKVLGTLSKWQKKFYSGKIKKNLFAFFCKFTSSWLVWRLRFFDWRPGTWLKWEKIFQREKVLKKFRCFFLAIWVFLTCLALLVLWLETWNMEKMWVRGEKFFLYEICL